MSNCCADKSCELEALRRRQASTLKVVLAINAAMFVVEFLAGLAAGSVSLVSDSLDMLGDALVYAFSLYAVAESHRTKALSALFKGLIMAVFALAAIGQAIHKLVVPQVPAFEAIGSIGMLALAANGVCFALLWHHRSDDINMSSVWLCSRNDLIANVAVILAAAGVWLTGMAWPDIAVGMAIAALFAKSAFTVLSGSVHALRQAPSSHSVKSAPQAALAADPGASQSKAPRHGVERLEAERKEIRTPMKRISLFYVLLLVAVGTAILGVLQLGASLPAPHGAKGGGLEHAVATADPEPVLSGLMEGLRANFEHPLGHLFLQLLVIIAVSRLVSRLFTRMGQPAVVGEMAAGILLGPSLFGLLAPGAFALVFPQDTLGTLRLLSQIGVCFFMFVVGMELNLGQVRSKAHAAVAVSHASILFPYLLGVLLAYFLYTDLAAPGTTFTAFALFMGISMSITAFPVLARILQDRSLSRTSLGNTAISCAAVDDVTAWSILAFVVAIARASSLDAAAFSLLLVLAFVTLMVAGVRRGLPRWIGQQGLAEPEPSKGTLATIVCVVVGAALSTELIGIHALFGAFLAGAIMPEAHGFRHKISMRVESFSSVLLLPLFFTFTGLRTQIGLLDDLDGWLLCLLIVAVATAGKLGGSAVAARLTGMGWRESLQLGALMNTRGLMELIALNIGYDLGILSARIFTMLVIMALLTTMLTGPLLALFTRHKAAANGLQDPTRT